MSQISNIEWTEATWNFLVGCDKVSPGCKNCYAINDAWRMAHNPNPKVSRKFLPVVKKENGKANWTGEITFSEDALMMPLRIKKPTKFFVNSLSDLFHRNVEDEWIDKAFAVMAMTPRHTYQILTKRPERMLEYFGKGNDFWPFLRLVDVDEQTTGQDSWFAIQMSKWAGRYEGDGPLQNVWLGVSVEDQKYADERRDFFRDAPAAVKFVSYEPALGAVNWTGWEFVDQIISGGESGPGASPTHPDWHRATRDFCQANGIAYFFKQWGSWSPFATTALYGKDSTFPGGYEQIGGACGGPHSLSHFETKDGRNYCLAKIFNESGEIEFEGRREMIDREDHRWGKENKLSMTYVRLGKKRSGRLLDGKIHNEFPKLQT